MNRKTRAEIGARLRAIREKLGLVQVDFAFKIGIARSTCCRCEKGECFLPTEAMQELAKSFNVSLNWLVLGQGEMFLSKATASDEVLMFVKESSEVEELLLLMKKLPLFRYSVLQHFLRFKTDNPKLVVDALNPPAAAAA